MRRNNSLPRLPLDRKARKGNRGHLVLKAIQDPRASKDPLDRKAPLDHKGNKDPSVLRVSRGHKDLKDSKVIPDLLGSKANLELFLSLMPMEHYRRQ
jgi:hypothetical protein